MSAFVPTTTLPLSTHRSLPALRRPSAIPQLPRPTQRPTMVLAHNSPAATDAGKPRKTSSSSHLSLGTVIAIGLSHHTATVEIREKLSIPEDSWIAAAKDLIDLPSITEAAVLSTCNRFEIYLVSEPYANPAVAIHHAARYLASRSGVPYATLRKYLFFLHGDPASFHLFRVAAGLDSLVVGEGQILAQVKRCYEIASAKDGHGGKILTRLLNTVVAAGKRVRSETAIAKGAVSISSAAVELVEMKVDDPKTGPAKNIQQATYAIIGAGNMARLLVQHLASKGVSSVMLVNRSRDRADELAKQFPDVHIVVRLLEEMLDVVSESDVVFTSTSSTVPILDKDNVQQAVTASTNQRAGKLMLVDISVPRNVHENVNELSSAVAYNVDDLKAVVAKNQARRRRLIAQAEDLLKEELHQFNNWHHSLGAVPAITKLQKHAEGIRLEELERVMGKLSDLSPAQKEAVQRLSKGIINKMLHGPMNHLRGLQDMEERALLLKNFEALFNI